MVRESIIRKKLVLVFLQIIISMFYSSSAWSEEFVTNERRTDGFGAQFQSIVCAIIYAELNCLPFKYTPFESMEHNYDSDPDFLAKKELLVNIIRFFPINQDVGAQDKIPLIFHIKFCEQHLQECVNSRSLKKLKKIFRVDKSRQQYFDANKFHIAVHVRRPNAQDVYIGDRGTPDSVHRSIIEALREEFALKNPIFHIYSQGNEARFREIFPGDDIVFHIDTSLEDTFTSMVFADVLVTSRSSLSYIAGWLSEGIVYYMPFWHPPLPYWKTTDELIVTKN